MVSLLRTKFAQQIFNPGVAADTHGCHAVAASDVRIGAVGEKKLRDLRLAVFRGHPQ